MPFTASKKIVYAYSAYGEATTLGPDGGNSLQYTGRENDGTGLYYYRARYFDFILKQWISEDPIGLRGGINQRAFVEGDPVSKSDPTGLLSACQIGWLNQNYGTFGGFLVNFFNLQQFNPNNPEIGKVVAQAGVAAGAKYSLPAGVQYAGVQVAQRAATAAASLAGQSVAFAGFCASATLTAASGGFSAFATLAYQLSIQACTDPLTGRQRE